MLRETRHAARRGQQVPDRIRGGDADGRIAAPLLAAGAVVRRAARTRRRAEEDRGSWRGTARLPRHKRAGRRHRSILPPSRRQSLARPQRGMRHPMRLSRLEVRHRRRLPRHPDLNAKDKIRIKAYPVREWGDMIWAYMGPAAEVPELPALEMALLPPSHR